MFVGDTSLGVQPSDTKVEPLFSLDGIAVLLFFFLN